LESRDQSQSNRQHGTQPVPKRETGKSFTRRDRTIDLLTPSRYSLVMSSHTINYIAIRFIQPRNLASLTSYGALLINSYWIKRRQTLSRESKSAMSGSNDDGPADAVASGAKFVLEPKEVVSQVPV
jgi:hypothetical protein